MYKQAIVFRKDLKISKGKMISQGCHACLGSFLEADEKIKSIWLKEGSKKIILTVKNLKVWTRGMFKPESKTKTTILSLYKSVRFSKIFPCFMQSGHGIE